MEVVVAPGWGNGFLSDVPSTTFGLLSQPTNVSSSNIYSMKLQDHSNKSGKLDQVYCAWLKKGLLCLYILYWVGKGLVCLYILEKVEIWSGDTDAWLTHWQTTEDRATQLLSSIQFKLSHATSNPWTNRNNFYKQKQEAKCSLDKHKQFEQTSKQSNKWTNNHIYHPNEETDNQTKCSMDKHE